MVKVALIGATGKSGVRIQHELLARGHSVIAVARDASRVVDADKVTVRVGNVVSDDLVPLISGADVVVHAYAPPQGNEVEIVGVTQRLAEAVKAAGVPRLFMVGGAGGLSVAGSDKLTIDQPWFPKDYVPIAQAHIDALNVLRGSDINWTTLSPPGVFAPGERTGKFRVGAEELLFSEAGESRISMEDYAIAVVDELEKAEHQRQRYTVGY